MQDFGGSLGQDEALVDPWGFVSLASFASFRPWDPIRWLFLHFLRFLSGRKFSFSFSLFLRLCFHLGFGLLLAFSGSLLDLSYAFGFFVELLDFSSNLRSFWSLFALPVLDFMMLFVYSDFPSPGSFFLDLIFFAWSLKPTTVPPSPRTPVTMPGLKDHVGNRTESDERCSGATDPLDTHAAAALQSAVHPGRSSIPTASMMFCFS